MAALKDKLVTVEDLKAGFDYNKNKIGDLNSLSTTTKTDLVSAINSIKSSFSNTYSSTGTVPITGTALNEAISGLDVNNIGGSGKYITKISETDGKISVSYANVISTYNAVSVVPANGVAVTAAIGKLDATDTPVANQYVSSVSEIDGVIYVDRTDLSSENVTYDNTSSAMTAENSQDAIDELKSLRDGSCRFYTNNFNTSVTTIAAGGRASNLTLGGFSDVVNAGYYPAGVIGIYNYSGDMSDVSIDGFYVKGSTGLVSVSNRRTNKSVSIQIRVSILFVKADCYEITDLTSF